MALSRLAKLARDGQSDGIRRFLNAFLSEAQLGVRGEPADLPLQLDLPADGRATPEV